MKPPPRRRSHRHDRPPLQRGLGQHHLRSGEICRPLLAFLDLHAGDRVVEIGPGGGVLTRVLLARGVQVAAIEIDPLWAFALRSRLDAVTELAICTIVVADALTLDWRHLPAGWRIAGNLPYNVGTAIVERLLAKAPAGTRSGFLLQREVVDRIVAKVGDAAYGALSLSVSLRARAERLAVVRPGAFVPPPKVESAFVGLESVAPPVPEREMPELERLIRIAFSQRRKSLRNSLASGYGRSAAEAALGAAGVAPGRRAEELALEEFLALKAALARR